jgi:muconate cycloisomerase
VKITRIETIPVRVPIKPRLAIKSGLGGTHSTSPFLIVKVHTDEGVVGLGEASCTPRWSGEDQFTARHFVENYFAPLLIGQDPTDIEACSKLFMPVVANNPFTKSAIEMALWDIAGKAAGKPVYELLGGKVREYVPTKFSISGRAPEEAAGIATWAVEQGFKSMKVKVGIDPAGDVARFDAIRAAVPPRTPLGVDANGGWKSWKEALNVIVRLDRPKFVEQPLPAFELFGCVSLIEAIPVPIVADESCYTLQDARNIIEVGAAHVLSIYVGKAGGIGPARAIAEFARGENTKVTIGSNLELGVGSAAMTHLGLATRAVNAEEYPCDIIGPLFYEDDILAEPLPIKGGEARVHDRPGLGVELDDEKVEKYRVR